MSIDCRVQLDQLPLLNQVNFEWLMDPVLTFFPGVELLSIHRVHSSDCCGQ
ncbi:hypothetical protein ABKV19_005350 [Rosa sericea]